MRNHLKKIYSAVFAFLLLLGAGSLPALAGVTGQIGPYNVELATDPATIPIGRANVLLKLTDAQGQPVQDATIVTLVKMPTMDMGESEQRAAPQAEPGVYMAPAVFSMEGPYVAIMEISGPQGEAKGDIPLRTGQNTGTLGGEAGGSPALRLLPWLAGLLLVVFVIFRMRKTGQRVNWRQALTWQTVAGIAVLVGMLAFALFAIENWRRPGAMTPIEAQAMEMNTPAPPTGAPVVLTQVSRGPVLETVRYTGQATGYVEQDVYPRVRGWITWMPLYAGDRVKKGQVIARLDTSEIEPQIAEREAMANMAEQGANVARTEYRQSLEDVNQMRAEARGKEAALRDARAGVNSAQAERSEAEAELAAAQTMVADAQAMLEAAKANNAYWQSQVNRTRELQKAGAASGEEVQREQSMAAEAAAKVRQANARIKQVNAEIRAKQSAVRRASAMIEGATAKLAQMTSEVEAARAQTRAAQASAEASRARIGESTAGVAQARAAAAATATQRGYSEIRAFVDGVVTQRLISPGVLVNPGQAILKIAQVNPIRLQANVAEADLKRIAVGNSVVLRDKTGEGKPAYAKVTSIAPSIDPATRTGIVEAVYQNPTERFLPGEYVVMEITLGKSANAVRVPTAAVQTRTRASGGVLSTESGAFVWVAEPVKGLEGQFTARQVSVVTGRSGDGWVEIVSGLEEGQRVVKAGHQGLREGEDLIPSGAVKTASSGSSGSNGSGGHAGHGM